MRILNSVRRLFARPASRLSGWKPLVEQLEDRSLLSTYVIGKTLPSLELRGGDRNVPAWEGYLLQTSFARSMEFHFSGATKSSLNDIAFAKVLEDRDWNGTFETTVAAGRPFGDDLALWMRPGFTRPGARSLRVEVDLVAKPAGKELGLTYNRLDIRGSARFPQFAWYFGPRTSVVHRIAQPKEMADLSVWLAGPAKVNQGDKIVYTVTAKNAGPDAAIGIYGKMAIPKGLEFDAAGSSRTVQLQGDIVLWKPGSLKSGEASTGTISFMTTAKTPELVSGSMAVSSGTTDPNPANNQSPTVFTTVVAQQQKGTIDVAVKSIGTADVAVKNQKNVNLFTYEVRASGRDTLLTGTQFVASQGNLNNAQNYNWWVDTDFDNKVDTIIEKGVPAMNGTVRFDKPVGGGFVIPVDKSVRFEVHTDIAPSLVPGQEMLQLAFDTKASDYIQAEDVNTGGPLVGIKTDGQGSGDITVVTTPSITYMLKSNGSLYVQKDTVPVRSHQLLAGATGDEVLRLTFHAEYEAADVTKIHLSPEGGSAQSVDRFELYLEGALTPFATATVGGTGSDDVPPGTFTANMQSQQLLIPKGQDVKVLVKPRLKSDVDGAVIGKAVKLFLSEDPVIDAATGRGAVHARGLSSSNNYAGNDGDAMDEGEVFIGTSTPAANVRIVGIGHTVVFSKTVGIVNANPDPNGTPVPVGVSAIGLLKHIVAANVNSKNGLNKQAYDGFIYNVNATNVSIATDSFAIYNKANSTVKAYGTVLNTDGTPVTTLTVTGSFLVLFDHLLDSSVNTVIDQGTDATFVVEANILNPKVTNQASTLQVSLQNFNDSSYGAFGAQGSHVKLKDRDNSPATSRDQFWIEYADSVVKSTSYQS
ncbi:MAG: conserved repeat domain protein [Candidatus Peregrinibacteria bacterium Greene0416_19]|nr:MAG: conserved repeat domain protein [Candidatus Peregrinibacteria bacterium Greene0416_19]